MRKLIVRLRLCWEFAGIVVAVVVTLWPMFIQAKAMERQLRENRLRPVRTDYGSLSEMIETINEGSTRH